MPAARRPPAPATQADIRRLSKAIKDLADQQAAAAVAAGVVAGEQAATSRELERLRQNLNKTAFALFGLLLAIAAPLIVKALGG